MQTWDYRQLRVWARARDLAISIYRVTDGPRFRRDWALRDQMRRSAISVPSNVAEGVQRESSADCARFLQFSKGSLAELCTQVEIAAALGFLEADTARDLEAECEGIRRMLAALIARRTHPRR